MKRNIYSTIVMLSMTGSIWSGYAQELLLNEFVASNGRSLFLEDGQTPDWIEIINKGDSAINLDGYSLADETGTDDLWFFPDIEIPQKGFILAICSGIEFQPAEIQIEGPQGETLKVKTVYTSFRLNASGETIVFRDSSNRVIDSITYPALDADVSMGRNPDSTNEWVYFYHPTPGYENGSDGINNMAEYNISFNYSSGIFSSDFDLELATDNSQGIIHYTTDGSEPDIVSAIYEHQINITGSTVVRAILEINGDLIGRTKTHVYISSNDFDAENMPIISIATDPEHLYDKNVGLFPNADDRVLEKPVHFMLIEPDGKMGISTNAGLKIFGNEPSPGFHQHKLALFARKIYGSGKFNYHFFPDKAITGFESLILRNPHTEIRDVLASKLIDNDVVARQSYLPVIVFINGEYWGTKFLREKINEHFVASNFDVHPDSIDVLNGIESEVEYYNEEWPIAGDMEDYKDLIDYLIDHDLSDTANYRDIKTRINIENIITYWASQIYYGNMDWPGNNTKFWRQKNGDGRWNWILFDVDAGMGAWENYSFNSVVHATEPNGPPQWPNPPWSTFIIRKLLKNEIFRTQFILRCQDLLNTDFTADKVINELNAIKHQTSDEIDRHNKRWDGEDDDYWKNSIDEITDFASYRTEAVRNHLKDYFDLGPYHNVMIGTNIHGAGSVRINSKKLDLLPWEGEYSEGLSLVLEAMPAYGFSFSEWKELQNTNKQLIHDINGSVSFTAAFEKQSWYEQIVINEINYNSPENANTSDWIELFNNGQTSVDMSRWFLVDKDSTHRFIFPEGTNLGAKEFIVVAENYLSFLLQHPDVSPVNGEMGFKLDNGGEIIQLFSDEGILIDQVEYDDFTPWPLIADGKGPTLSLNHPDLDNSLGTNWSGSAIYGGTPGGYNWEMASSGQTVSEISSMLSLSSWPNPFRGSAMIHFELDQQSKVKLLVYDVNGSLIETLCSGVFPTGTHETIWNANQNEAGIYICRIVTETRSETIKLILLD
jgi:hypothetical protein